MECCMLLIHRFDVVMHWKKLSREIEPPVQPISATWTASDIWRETLRGILRWIRAGFDCKVDPMTSSGSYSLQPFAPCTYDLVDSKAFDSMSRAYSDVTHSKQ